MEPLLTWAGNRAYAGTLVHPGSLDEAADVVARSRHVRALGSRHGFNDAADSQGALVSLDRLAYRHPGSRTGPDDLTGGPEPRLDPATGHVWVPAATRYADLALFLADHGRTLPNFASLPHITVAGAVVTATHGSGTGNPVLAASVVGLDLLLADGTERRLHRDTDGDVLDGATVSLGALGLVHGVTLATVPAFDVAQTVYGPLPLAGLVEAFDEVSALGYSVSCFTTLRGPDVETVWVKRLADEGMPEEVLGAKALTSPVHPIPGVDPANCTPQGGVPGPAADRLPHFRAEGMPSAGAEIQCEYLVPREEARAALRALAGLARPLAGLLQVCEVRSVAADRAWLSPMHDQPCVAVHLTLVRDVERVAAVLPLVEAAFAPLGGRPHWGKVSAADPARVRGLYPRRADFLDLARTLDPERKFTNAFVRRWVG
ncbi:FAD-binding protein [Georgenia sp. 311]|uniref:D-arabinono-1,4-lactone oxidase n=1 Tax=Georgenia sp. 311 TaxID=2585134 RepID=UPI0011118E64|nr:D-arabinono-1,4-lactone oxidase [Georgenia sp. 311]TNC17282.1 FAD-binding protein [Georgenia sp. 311]